jgi:hypothetical protein
VHQKLVGQHVQDGPLPGQFGGMTPLDVGFCGAQLPLLMYIAVSLEFRDSLRDLRKPRPQASRCLLLVLSERVVSVSRDACSSFGAGGPRCASGRACSRRAAALAQRPRLPRAYAQLTGER